MLPFTSFLNMQHTYHFHDNINLYSITKDRKEQDKLEKPAI